MELIIFLLVFSVIICLPSWHVKRNVHLRQKMMYDFNRPTTGSSRPEPLSYINYYAPSSLRPTTGSGGYNYSVTEPKPFSGSDTKR